MRFSEYVGLTIEVHGAAAVGVNLLDEAVQFLFCELLVQLAQDLAQTRSGNVTVACQCKGP